MHSFMGNAPAGQARALKQKQWGNTNDCTAVGEKCVHADIMGAVSHQHAMAIAYARWGIAVGALYGKAPLSRKAGHFDALTKNEGLTRWQANRLLGLQPHAVQSFTTDEDHIRQMWELCPALNVGGRPPRGVVVLDVDLKNDGVNTWNRISPLPFDEWKPDTLTTRSGSGGRHAWYRVPFDLPMVGKIQPGIDVQHGNKQLVMPGSVHPDTGNFYLCERWVWPPAMLPEHWWSHVYEDLRPARRVSPVALVTGSAARGLVNKVRNTSEGNRNDLLNWAAYEAALKGIDLDAELLEAALSIGLGEREIRSTLASARKAGRKAVA